MSDVAPLFDTHVLLYLLSADTLKADRAESLLAGGGTVSVQVLNEFAAVALRKLAMTVTELREILEPVRSVCRVEPVTEDTHDRALALAERSGFSCYDALLVAAAQTSSRWCCLSLPTGSSVPADASRHRIDLVLGDPHGLAVTALREVLGRLHRDDARKTYTCVRAA